MAPSIGDRWLWLGFGIILFVAARGIRSAIRDIVRLTEIHPSQFPENVENEADHAEESINISALKALTTHPNQNIANAAKSLVVHRFVQLPNIAEELANDVHSSDETVRRQARQAVAFFKDWPLPPGAEYASTYNLPWTLDDFHEGWNVTEVRDRRSNVDGGLVVPSVQTPVAGWTNVPRERPEGGLDVAETDRRRRRREVMVLHEGAGRVEEGDIIRPR